ncbi:MAG: hemerythrin domain-containing protein [Betaproteobacteria bacterium]|nr:hemerythrin domain-containing protein [Betaproteobacteria bacterium]MDH5285666.1 hemerythrin domain-containing protein [Betaproteobacteria bacterium]
MNDLIGEPGAPSFDDPLGMLRACHGRIERQLGTLRRLAAHLPGHGADRDAQAAARAILRYFDDAAPNHHADEEASVFPRLLARAPSARETIAALERDHHGAFEANWRRLRPLLAAIAAGSRETLPPALVREVCDAYAAHIALENDRLIPLCAETLTPAELAAIGAEMAARRGVPWPGK